MIKHHIQISDKRAHYRFTFTTNYRCDDSHLVQISGIQKKNKLQVMHHHNTHKVSEQWI
jgi:hypothetical protein